MEKVRESGIVYKLYDNRGRLMFVTPVRRNVVDEVSEYLGRKVSSITYDTMISGLCKVVICEEGKKK